MKNKAPESYTDEMAIMFYDWCEENKGWTDKYSTREKLVIFKRQAASEELPADRCRCIRYINGVNWYSKGCEIHQEEK